MDGDNWQFRGGGYWRGGRGGVAERETGYATPTSQSSSFPRLFCKCRRPEGAKESHARPRSPSSSDHQSSDNVLPRPRLDGPSLDPSPLLRPLSTCRGPIPCPGRPEHHPGLCYLGQAPICFDGKEPGGGRSEALCVTHTYAYSSKDRWWFLASPY